MIGISNLIKWFKIIWNDRDWDFAYLLKILRFKLENMRDSARTDWITERALDDADQMDECVQLISNIIENKHEELAIALHEEKYGPSVFESGDSYGITYPLADDKEASAAMSEAFTKAYQQEQNDVNRLFEIMKNILHWWD